MSARWLDAKTNRSRHCCTTVVGHCIIRTYVRSAGCGGYGSWVDCSRTRGSCWLMILPRPASEVVVDGGTVCGGAVAAPKRDRACSHAAFCSSVATAGSIG